ncbi:MULTISPECIES: restriction endonuclease subunit S [unclassified Bradyrhizobium]|uniref:restriction endonuclease subunit S n=1 Tax=unclassified Bradyrhizobium TaxID=2631580 RepID=UPI002916E70A|nr:MULTISPECIES: restriction endonuclease subunit S [unclassified Bradyrhizobium]
MSKPLSSFAEIHYGKSPARVVAEEGDVPIYGTGGVYGKATKSLFPGPAVIIPRKGSLASPHFAAGPFWASDTTYAAIPKPGVDAEWLYYQLCQFNLERLNEATGVPSISRDWLAKSGLFPHDADGQTAVARVLRTIDSQIQTTELLIAKQERVRAGLMQDLFTRGVDDHGRLRPPREEAPHLYHQTELGWLPKGWDVGPLSKWVSRVTYGFTNPMPEALEGPYMVTAADVSDGEICLETCRRTTDRAYADLLTNKSKPKVGDILLTKDGTLGRVALVDCDNICVNQSVAVITPFDIANSKFFFSIFRTSQYQARLIADAGGSTIKHIYITNVEKMLFTKPEKDEERDLIVAICGAVEKGLLEERKRLAKAKLLKSGLMQDLLAGRVYVGSLLRDAPEGVAG